MRETTVGTRELKNRLSEYLRRVKAGETVIITERGKPVGQIVPVQADLASRLVKLAEAGVVEWNGLPVPAYEPKAVNRSQQLLSDLVLEASVHLASALAWKDMTGGEVVFACYDKNLAKAAGQESLQIWPEGAG